MDLCECGHDAIDDHDMRSAPPTCNLCDCGECRHPDIDPDLGFAGDPAREYPDGRGTCAVCGEYVEPDEQEYDDDL